jgi:hypothetical protein
VTEEIREEIKKFIEFNENKYTTYQNLWNMAKAGLRGKSTVICAYIIKTDTSWINDPMMHLKLLQTRTNQSQNQ